MRGPTGLLSHRTSHKWRHSALGRSYLVLLTNGTITLPVISGIAVAHEPPNQDIVPMNCSVEFIELLDGNYKGKKRHMPI